MAIKMNKLFKIRDLFDLYKGTRLTKTDMVNGTTNYLGAIDDNNGVRQKIDAIPKFSGHFITVNYNGSVGEAFYQSQPFWASDDVNVLDLKSYELNKELAMYLVTIIKANKHKFSYGRKWTSEKMLDTEISLPVTIEGNPDWQYMEDYIKSLNLKLQETGIERHMQALNTDVWKEFCLKDIFDCKTTPHVIDVEDGNHPYVTRTSVNNGVQRHVDICDNKPNAGNCITVGAEGAVAFYQNKPFIAGVKVYTLRNEYLNIYNGLFLCTVLNSHVYKYSYGRARILEKLKNETILLPAKMGNPDWQYMEDYIKQLPYSDRI